VSAAARGVRFATGCIASMLAAGAHAGVFLNQTTGRVTHAGRYDGAGGERVVNVCLDPTAMPAVGDPAQATRNAIAEFNRFQGLLGNVGSAAGAGVPAGQVDYQSIVTHELGHCTGLDHNVLGPSEVGCSLGVAGTCNNSPTLFFTNTAPNIGVTNAGVDGARATGDDIRNVANRHWYRAGVNNPFLEPATADRTTHVQSGSLPVGDLFAEAVTSYSPCTAGSATSNTSAANGQPATSDVMFPILCISNVVRDLSPNDRTTFRIARAGLDGVAGNGDDYTVRLVYQGTNQVGCDIQIRFPAGNGGFFCSTSLLVLGNGDESTGDNEPNAPAGVINLQRETPWFFNQTDTTAGNCIFRNGFEGALSTCN
jgi:hypothetical protein